MAETGTAVTHYQEITTNTELPEHLLGALGIHWFSHMVGYPQKPEMPQGKGSSTTQWKSLGHGRGHRATAGVLKPRWESRSHDEGCEP